MSGPMRLSAIMDGLPVEVVRDCDVAGFGGLNLTREGLLHYFGDARFAQQLEALSGGRSILTTPALAGSVDERYGLVLCDDPREIFLRAYLRHGAAIEAGDSVPNEIHPGARIHSSAVIAAQNVRIGANVAIGPGAVIQERVTIGEDAAIGANSVVGGDGCEIGMIDGRQIVLPHYGSVRIGAGAVIQSNCAIDWALFGGVTEIGEGSVLDNLVHVAHNVRIGRNCQIFSAASLAGSCVIEDGARIGPNATISNGVRVGAGARVTLGSVVARNVPDGGHVTGNFAVPHFQFLRKAGRDHVTYSR